ncbi:hypothetical protein [Alicyclobacillus shizuokensis]|uniref:hypothetical protein n=1 Tax=Alicyclobacillus shizuokensis TaxID=392014 RepID=UPI000836D99E|nr:hypothetical protein [Alicyclobacillus shizuokensis]
MNIKQIQIRRAVEQIVRYYLKYGRYPTFQTITYQLSQWLRDHTPGAPSFSPYKVLRKSRSDANLFNENIAQIAQDLSDAYAATIDQTTSLMTSFNYMEAERRKLWHALAELQNEIEQLMLVATNSSGYVDSQIISFEDMSDVDKTRSTVFIDLNTGQVTLPPNDRSSEKINIQGSNTTFNVLTQAAKTAALDTINNAFDDNANTAWWQVVKMLSPGVVNAELIVMFDQQYVINQIDYVNHANSPVTMHVSYTEDGTSFSPIPGDNQQVVSDAATWKFSDVPAKGIRFTYTKQTHDDNSAGVYQYYFGAKNISVYRKSYLTSGVLISNPVQMEELHVSGVSIKTTDTIPYSTSIDYAVALYDPDQSVDDAVWYPISSLDDTNPKYPKVVQFNASTTKTVEFPKAEPTTEVINGMPVFRLIREDGEPVLPDEDTFDNIKNPKLFRGINQWKREQTYVPFTGNVPLNSAWDDIYTNRPSLVTTDYWPIGNTLSLQRVNGGDKNNFYRFTTCIYSETDRTVPMSLSVIQTDATTGMKKRLGTFAVYVNNQRMVASNDQVTLPLQAGWNQIQILYHWGDMANRTDMDPANLPTTTYLGMFNFSAEPKVRAELDSLTFVDVHTLYHNISPNDHGYCAIYDNQIVLNYQPKDCIFQLVYDVSSNDNPTNQILVKATLSREADTDGLTPIISKIEVRAM